MSAAEWNLGMPPWSADCEHALAYVRPEHLALDMTMDAPGWRTRLRHVYLTGSVAHLELDVPVLGQHLEVQIASEDLATLGLRTGMQLRVRPRQAIVFPADASKHPISADHARWLWRYEDGIDSTTPSRLIPAN